jgi:hypothetical protein
MGSAGAWVRSFAIITTTPNELCAELHNRMPVVLGARDSAGLTREGAGGHALAQSASCVKGRLLGLPRYFDRAAVSPEDVRRHRQHPLA